MGYYEMAQICINGHPITAYAKSQPEFMKKFCSECGGKTITHCVNCEAEIQGKYESDLFSDMTEYHPPKFCHECGKAYPWTESKLNAAKELADELENISKEEKEILKSSLDDLIVDNPNTELAVHRFKKIASKVGIEGAKSLKSILINIVTESAREGLWGAPTS